MIQEERLQELTECYLKSVIMKISSLDNADFESSISFGDMGIDSFGTIKIIKELESDFGILPKTFLNP